MNPELVDWIWRAVIGLVIGLILYAVKDWRKTRNENELAEETKQPRVKKAGIEALEAQILAMSRAWEEERKSKNEQIKDLKELHGECKSRIEKAEGLVRDAQKKMGEMRDELDRFRSQLATFTNIEADPREDQL